MERNIKLTLEKAQEWYNIGGELKEIALQAFNESELKSFTYIDIYKKLFAKNFFDVDVYGAIKSRKTITQLDACCPNNAVSYHQLSQLLELNKLINIAKFLNKDWEPNWKDFDEYKYYIWYNPHNNEIVIDRCVGSKDMNVYFKSYDLAEQAIKIIGKNSIKLMYSSNW